MTSTAITSALHEHIAKEAVIMKEVMKIGY